MAKLKKPSLLFIKYLASYIAVLCIPLAIVFIFVYAQFINILNHEVNVNNLNTLNKFKNVVDSEIEQLQNISFQMKLNRNLKPFYFSNDPFRALAVKAELLNYKSTNNFISEILIYFRGDSYLYSAKTSCSIDIFSSSIFHYEKWDSKHFYNDLNTVNSNIIRPVDNVLVNNDTLEQYITFLFPLSYSSTPYGTAVFMVPRSSLKSLTKNYFNTNSSNTLILDQSNNIIYSSEYMDSGYYDKIRQLIDSPGETYSENIRINSSDYIFNLIKSKNSGLKYISTVPTNEVLEKVINVKKIMFLGVIIIVFVGSITIYYLMYINYYPLNRLKAYSDSILTPARSKNDIESVKKTIEYLSSNNIELSAKVKDSELAAKEHLLLSLLNGSIKSEEEFVQKSGSLDIVLNNPYYSVAICFIYGLQHIKKGIEKQNIIREIGLNSSDHFQLYAVDHIESDKVILLFSTDSPELPSIEKNLLDLQAYFRTQHELLFTIGVGDIHDSILSIPMSYMEASASINYRLVKGNGRVIFFREFTRNRYMFELYPQKDLEILKLSIKQSDISQIENSINKIIGFIKENNTPIFVARGLCFDIINTVIKTSHDINRDLAIEKKAYPDVFSLTEFETVEELSEIIMNVCSDVCNFVSESNKCRDANLTEQIIAYIKENYTNYSFSIDEISTHFNMSPPSLSLYFKEHIGQTFIDYVTCLRFDKAKLLLESSDLPLKDIAVSVGYFNTSSFIRRFKVVIGITPGEYRNMYGIK